MNPAKTLWKKRLSAHIRVVARYTVYAGQSGLFLFLLVALLASSYLYGKALGRIPETFPYVLVLTCWLTPFMAISPIRTLLREADLVFVLPLEARMGEYFRGAFGYSFLTQSFAVVFAVSALMPLYRYGYGDDAVPYAALLPLALVLKFANLLGVWVESSFVRSGVRGSFRFVRWLADAVIGYALFRYGLLAGCIAVIVSLAVLGSWARGARTLRINWPYLRLKEAGHRTALLLFFNGFVDVDELPNRVKPRRTLSRMANAVPLRQENAFRYLYLLTLLRSELFGIVVRLTLLAFVILLFTNSPVTYAAVYVLFVAATGVQLSALSRFHRHAVWPALYPLPASLRPASAARVAFAVQLVQAVVLAVPMLRPAVFVPWLLLLLPVGATIAIAFRSRTGRPRKGRTS